MKKFIAVVFAAVVAFMSIFPLNAFALDFDSCQVELEWSNAPKNTAYIDILVKMDTDDENYIDFTVPPKRMTGKYLENGTTKFKFENLPIDKDSEIAQLNDDGWVSLSLHHKGSGGIAIWNKPVLCLDYYYDEDCLKAKSDSTYCNIITISKDYGRFKCAYVDESGNVLGITTGESRKSYDMSEPYAIIADGDNVTFRIFGMSPFAEMILIVMIYGVPIFLLLVILYLLYRLIVNKVRKSRLHYGDE